MRTSFGAIFSAARQHVARLGGLVRVEQRGGAPRRHFGVARVEPLHLRPRLGRLRPPALVLVELGELHAAAEELRLIVEQVRQRLDRGIGRAGGFLRVRQQDRPFRVLRLLEDDAAEERDGVGGTIARRGRGAPARDRSTDRRCRRRARSRARPSPASHTPPRRRPAAAAWRCSASAASTEPRMRLASWFFGSTLSASSAATTASAALSWRAYSPASSARGSALFGSSAMALRSAATASSILPPPSR